LDLGIFHFDGTKKSHTRIRGSRRHSLAPFILRAKDTDNIFSPRDEGIQYLFSKRTLTDQ
jgi:hypothetical protein